MKKIILFYFLLISFIASAQIEECGFDYLAKQLFETNSSIRKIMLNKNLYTNNTPINQFTEEDGEPEIVYTIPVVVHIINLGEAIGVGTNISNSHVYSAIEGMNQRFSNIIGAGLDIGIQFCLAQRDPNGDQTNGIDREDGSGIVGYGEYGVNYFTGDGCDGGVQHTTISNLYRWPVDDYYNIYILNTFDCGTGPAAFAYSPFWFADIGNIYDGSYFEYNHFSEISTTPTHELGHGFNLYHTFSGDGGGLYCPVDTNCLIDGDQVCDTPPHKSSDCGVTNPCSLVEPFSNSKNNYVSYCVTRNLFTQGQKIRMREIMDHKARKDLIDNPWVCDPTTSIDISLIKSNCVSISDGLNNLEISLKNLCDSIITYAEIVISIDSVYYGLYIWTGVLFPNSTVEISYAIDVPIGSHSVKVICQNPNEINQYDKDPTNDSQMYQLIQNTIEGCEDFSGDYLSDGWTLFQSYPYVDFMTTSYPCSPDVLQTYVPTCLFGFYDSTAINTLETTYNFSDATNYADIILSFDRANKNDNNVSKTTKLFVTGTNCNSGIDTLLYLEGATLASTPGNIPICNSWNPVFCSDWDTSNLSLCQYMGSIVTIEFEILSQYYSGNVYLDNICIDFIEKPNSEELIKSCDDTVFLSANVISNGYWSIIYGFGGHIFNASNPNSKFSGVHGNTYIITWNYLNGCGILYSDTTTINLLGTLNPIVEYDKSLCIGDTLSLFTMDDPSLNFNWSGPNGFISNINNPSISNVSELNSGVYSLFTFNDNGCISDTINVEINVFPIPGLPEIIGTDSICEGETILLTSGFDPDYSYYWSGPTGTFITDELLDITPATLADGGIYSLYVEENGCISEINNFVVSVNEKPSADLYLLGITEFCIGDSLFIEVIEDNLLYNWSTGGTAQDLVIFNSGEYFVTVEDSLGCVNVSDPVNVIVHNLPIVNFNILDTIMCINDDPLPLIYGSPVGGNYSGDSVIDNIFYPDLAGIGDHFIYYTYTDINGCSNTAVDSLKVSDLPIVTFDLTSNSICLNAGPIFIDFGLPTGGDYSGIGVSGNYFDPVIAGFGDQIIYYDFIDINGCYNTNSFNIIVYDCPTISISESNSSNEELSIQPNPNTGEFTLLLSSLCNGDVEISLFNSIGKLVMTDQGELMDNKFTKKYNFKNLAAGNYLVKAICDNNTYISKIVIQLN